MSKRTNTDFTTSSWDFLYREISNYFKEVQADVTEKREKGLTEASTFLCEKLIDKSPEDSGDLKKMWEITSKYKGVRYINNTRLTESDKRPVPLLDILEFSIKHGKAFVRKTFDENTEKIKEIILDNLKREN